MKIGNRKLAVVLSALFEQRHYIAARNMLRVYRNPVDAFGRYLLGRGEYPARIVINTPTGSLTLTVYSYHDILTINEVFCRLDYPATAQHRVIVDFGSNIGISAAYFLTSAPNSFVYLYEPLQSNIDRLRDNLRPFEGRYTLHEVAVGQADGEIEFGWEDTGRYGGVGLKTGKYVSVTCRDSNKILEEIITRHGRIDILKIDIETLERQVTERIPVAIARNIDWVYVEATFDSNPLERTHTYRQYGAVAQFVNKETDGSR
jgi:FkbM family methyltransferase